MRIVVGLVVGVAGCAEGRVAAEVSLPADGVGAISVDVERGDVALAGSLPTGFTVSTEAWARGWSERSAEKRAGRASPVARVVDGRLELVGRSKGPTAGVDFDEQGPSDLDVDAVLQHGDLDLSDLRGDLVASARAIVGRRVSGALDLTATDAGVDLDADPLPGDSIRIDAAGDTVLRLPPGGEYRLQVFPDPDFPGDVADLGFDDLSIAPDFVTGLAGSGSIDVAVVVRGGRFDLRRSGSDARRSGSDARRSAPDADSEP